MYELIMYVPSIKLGGVHIGGKCLECYGVLQQEIIIFNSMSFRRRYFARQK